MIDECYLQVDSTPNDKKQVKVQSTKELGCPAVLKYERIIKFPAYSILTEPDMSATRLKKLKESAVTNLLAGLLSSEHIEMFHLHVPTLESHDGRRHLSSALGKAAAGLSQRVNPK